MVATLDLRLAPEILAGNECVCSSKTHLNVTSHAETDELRASKSNEFLIRRPAMGCLRRSCGVDGWKRTCLGLGSWMVVIAVANGFGQTSPADAPWSGQAQCQITVQGPGYA